MNAWNIDKRFLSGLAGLTLGVAALPAAGQTTLEWFGLGDGSSFEDPLNWLQGLVPGPLDEAKFDEAGLQIVSFSSSPANTTASIENDTVVFNLNGGQYTLVELIVGDRLTDVGSLTLNGGLLRTTTGLAQIGRLGTSHGTLVLTNGAQVVNDKDLIIGDAARGNLEIGAACAVTSLNGFIADEVASQGDALIHGSWTILNSLVIGNAGTGAVHVEQGGDVLVTAQAPVGDEIGADGVLTVDGPGSTFTAFGVVTIGNFGTGSLAVTNGGQLSAGEFKVGDDATGVALVDASTIIDSTGTRLGDPTDLASGTLTLANGGMIQSPLVTVTEFGQLRGSGAVQGSVLNDGGVDPGETLGTLEVTGDYTQIFGTLNIELGGSTPGSEHDQLLVSGASTLGGTLNVSLSNGFSPTSGQFVIVQGGTVSGAFAVENLPSGFTVSYEPDRVVLSVDAGCQADVNGDGVLDNGDIGGFVNLFLTGNLNADFNGDGVLDNGDIGAFVIAFFAGCA